MLYNACYTGCYMKSRMIYQVEETRNRILKEAENLFRERGFFETQMKDVAARIGMSRNTVYRYFQDKSDLAISIIENILSERSRQFADNIKYLISDRSLSGLEKLNRVIRRGWLDRGEISDEKLMAEFDAYYSGERITSDMKEKFIHFEKDEWTGQIIKIIESGQADGSIRRDIDPHLAFVTILNGIRAINQRIILRGDVLVETIEGETDRMPSLLLDLLIDGLKGDKNERKK